MFIYKVAMQRDTQARRAPHLPAATGKLLQLLTPPPSPSALLLHTWTLSAVALLLVTLLLVTLLALTRP
jgi:hypothetical protein